MPELYETELSKNLMSERSQPSVWDRTPSKLSALQMYDRERWMTAAWGSALTMIGARRGGFGGGLLATLGAVVAVRAAMGHHDVRVARHWVDRLAGIPVAEQGPDHVPAHYHRRAHVAGRPRGVGDVAYAP